MARPFLTFLALALLVPWGHAPAADDLEDSRRRLEELERRIQDTARSLEEKQFSVRTLTGDLEAVDQEEKRIRRRIDNLVRETASLENQVAEKNRELDALKENIRRTEGLVRQRLKALYKGGESSGLRLLFSSVSPSRTAEDQDFLRRIVRRDRELLAAFRGQLAAEEELRRQLADLHGRRQAALDGLQQDQQSLRRALRLKEDLLARARHDETELGRELKGLRERAARLEGLVKKLESAKARAYTPLGGPFASLKGRLPWPVEGKVRVAFGRSRHPELGTLHESQGIEIAVDGERPVAAVGAGRVLFADAFRGFGQLLILDHGDGYYSLYAQAARLARKVGEQVRAGDVVAFSGQQGAGFLYFEIRRHGVPLDPADWLMAR